MTKTAISLAATLLACALQAATALDLLLPRPKEILPGEGTWAMDSNAITTVEDASLPPQGYRLTITPKGVTLAGNHAYARATLEQLRTLSGDAPLPCATITDYPTLPWRGLLHDTGRNWQPLDALKTQLDVLARYKFNLFQWHITDNHGWRLQSLRYPQLSAPENLDRSDNFYTQDDFRALIAYAHERGITVLPEFDIPGHTATFRRAFGLQRMDDPRVRQIISDLLDELTGLLDPAVTPYIHLGSDEVKPHERVPQSWLDGWAVQVEAKGFRIVAWGPGQPLATRAPLIRQYWMGRQMKRPEAAGYPYFDSQSSFYINHVDPFELLAAASFQQPCASGTPEDRLGAIFAVWHDDAIASPRDLLTMNPVAEAIALYSDTFWNGRVQDEMRYYANLPDPRDAAYALPADLERRLLAHIERGLLSPLPSSYRAQTQLRWRMAETDADLPFEQLPWQERILAQATLYPHHFFFPQGNLASKTAKCVTFGMVIESNAERDVPIILDCMNFSRSDGRSRDWALRPGQWNAKGATILLNGEPIPPPEWKQPGLAGPITREIPLVDEPWMTRPPQRVHLRKGRNTLLLRLPRAGWKWSATCAFPEAAGLRFLPPERR